MEVDQAPFLAVLRAPIWTSLNVASASEPVVNIQLWKIPMIAILLLFPICISYAGKLGLTRPLVISACRCLVQLLLLGGVLRLLLSNGDKMHWTMLYITFMMVVASLEAGSRPSMSYIGMQADVGVCLIIPASVALLYMVLVIIDPSPWFNPQYTVPLVGMMLGNSLNGVTVGVKTMLEALSAERAVVEWSLTMGATRWEAVGPVFKRVLYTALTPTINMLSVAGLVSIPGMMTGQILAGGDAVVAAKYQIMILFGVAAVGATACTMSIGLATARLTDSHHRLRLDRLMDHNYHAFKWIWSKIQTFFLAIWNTPIVAAIWNRIKFLGAPSIFLPRGAAGDGEYEHLNASTSGASAV